MTHTRWSVAFSLLVAVFVVAPFSYHPLLQLGSVAATHIDITLLYGILGSCAVASIPLLWRHHTLVWSHPAWRWLIAFWLYATLSVLWSANSVRGLLTVGFGWLLVLLVSFIMVKKSQLVVHASAIERWVRITMAASYGFALWQLLGDALHVSTALTLLPAMYSGDVFGVARPTAFALEPQFFGSLLLVAYGIWLWRSSMSLNRSTRWWLLITTALLFVTLSRGAILGAVLVTSLIGIAQWRRSNIRWTKVSTPLLGGILLGGALIFSAASVRAHSLEAGYQSIRASISHLSLGVVTLPPTTPTAHSSVTSSPQVSSYVASSTDSRLSMSALARHIWQQSPLFGTGSGSFGARAHTVSPIYPASSIANNYYLEMLAEVGIVGCILFAGFVTTLLTYLYRQHQWLLLALLAGAGLQWCFFSGNANVVHVWLLIGIALAVSMPAAKKARALP